MVSFGFWGCLLLKLTQTVPLLCRDEKLSSGGTRADTSGGSNVQSRRQENLTKTPTENLCRDVQIYKHD